jgi:hypothetical protein
MQRHHPAPSVSPIDRSFWMMGTVAGSTGETEVS